MGRFCKRHRFAWRIVFRRRPRHGHRLQTWNVKVVLRRVRRRSGCICNRELGMRQSQSRSNHSEMFVRTSEKGVAQVFVGIRLPREQQPLKLHLEGLPQLESNATKSVGRPQLKNQRRLLRRLSRPLVNRQTEPAMVRPRPPFC